jgi:medium-chain acyl-[acyl-carrier-protein] hydrolase
MTPDAARPWLRAVRPEARARVICLSFAGGGTAPFRTWGPSFPGTVDICPVVLPGRETRLSEPTIDEMGALIDQLLPALLPVLRRAPYAIYGHSMGSWVGYELIRALRRLGGPQPVHLFAAARRAPHLPLRGPVLSDIASDDAFLDAIQDKYDAVPAAIRANPEIMALFLPTLRADFGLLDRYRYTDEEPLPVPITALRGQRDDVVRHADVKAWSEHTTGDFVLRTVPGGHFFLEESADLVAAMIAAALR